MSKPTVIIVKDKGKGKAKAKDKARKSRDVKFKKLFKLLNIHVSFHLVNNTKKYIMIINLNMLARELKYKLLYYFLRVHNS